MHRGERSGTDCIPGRLRGGAVGDEHSGAAGPGVHGVDEILRPQIVRCHIDKLLDVNRRDHSLVRAIRTAVRAFDACALAAFHDKLRHPFARQDDSAVGLDAAYQRLRKRARSAFRQRTALALLVKGDVREAPGKRIERRLQRPRTREHERAAMVILESVAHDFPHGHRHAPLPELAMRVLRQLLVHRLAEADRRKRIGLENRLDLLVLGNHPPIRQSIALGELCKLRAGATQIAPLRQVTAVGKRHVKDGVGENIFEAVLAELELVVAQHGIVLDHVVCRGANVVLESAQGQFRGLDPASGDGPPFEDHTVITGAGPVRRGDQTVVPRAGDHDVKALWHCYSVETSGTGAATEATLELMAKLRCTVSPSISSSQRATTIVATALPIMLTMARNMLKKRSIPKITAMPATGMVGTTISVPTSAMNAAPCTPLAPFDVRTATAKMVSCCVSVRCVLVAWATKSAASVMYMLVPSVLNV